MRVLVIADNLLARTGLSALVSLNPDIDVVGQIAPTATLSDDVDVYQPDVVLYDLGYNASSTLPTLDLISDMPIVVLVPSSDDVMPVVGLLSEAGTDTGAGAFGILLRDSETDVLSTALITVYRGLVVIDPVLVSDFTIPRTLEDDELVDELTPREFEVLQLIAEGLPNKQIAIQLEISPNTVKFHINAILSKLNAQSRTEAVVRATRLGLIIL